jgi:hypothetical protein
MWSVGQNETQNTQVTRSIFAFPHQAHLAGSKNTETTTEVERVESRNQIADSLGGVVFSDKQDG